MATRLHRQLTPVIPMPLFPERSNRGCDVRTVADSSVPQPKLVTDSATAAKDGHFSRRNRRGFRVASTLFLSPFQTLQSVRFAQYDKSTIRARAVRVRYRARLFTAYRSTRVCARKRRERRVLTAPVESGIGGMHSFRVVRRRESRRRRSYAVPGSFRENRPRPSEPAHPCSQCRRRDVGGCRRE